MKPINIIVAQSEDTIVLQAVFVDLNTNKLISNGTVIQNWWKNFM